MTGYNPLNSVKVNLESVGICPLDGMRFTDPNCPHGTPEQIAHCKEIDERMDNEDIFGHPVEQVIDSSLKMVRIPFDDHSVPVSERVAMAYGQSALPHDAESRPTYDQLLDGAKFTDEHSAELHKWWNEKYK